MNTYRRQSILVGGLISSLGVFISKILGLLYVVPYYPIIESSTNLSYYSQSYLIYSYILNIATAGLPFAIATMIARYMSRNDYRTCLLVRKLSTIVMAGFGLVCALLMGLLSPMIAKQILEVGNIETFSRILVILALAVFIVPILSAVRGFYQGLKELEIYSTSQVIEQFVRIIFLLLASAIAVFVFRMDRIWGVYFGVFAASLSALVTIFYIQNRGKKKLYAIKQMAKNQTIKSHTSIPQLLKELILLAIPFFINAIFGYSDSIINLMQSTSALGAYGVSLSEIQILKNAMNAYATKIIAIPMVLAPGFSSAIIPYITASLEKGNIKEVKKHIVDCVDTVLYITLPIIAAFLMFPELLLYVLFPASATHMEVNAYVLRWYALEALFATFLPVTTTLVMAIGERRRITIYTIIFALIKLSINFSFVHLFGVAGFVLSSAIAYSVLLVLNLRLIQRKYSINWLYSLRKLVFVGIGLLGFAFVAKIFALIGFSDYGGSNMLALLRLGLVGTCALLAYLGVTAYFQIPQVIFHLDISKFLKRWRGRRS
ncbi:MAG: oligosaccharide flippase family protein [Breznakia sp.]